MGGREGEGSCLVFTVKMVIPMSGRQERTTASQRMETFYCLFSNVLGRQGALSGGQLFFAERCCIKMDQ